MAARRRRGPGRLRLLHRAVTEPEDLVQVTIQHVNARNRWDDLIPVIERFPDLLGLGISEDTAIVVTGDRFEVIGA